VSNQFYAKGLGAFADAGINWASDNIKAALVTSAYTPDTSASGDQFLSTISGIGGAILARSGNLSSKTNVGGVLNADNLTWSLVPSGTAKYVVIYKDTGSDATSPLIIIDDTANNLPCLANGGNITAQWSTGPNKIGAL
jgi:hypothetical protein